MKLHDKTISAVLLILFLIAFAAGFIMSTSVSYALAEQVLVTGASDEANADGSLIDDALVGPDICGANDVADIDTSSTDSIDIKLTTDSSNPAEDTEDTTHSALYYSLQAEATDILGTLQSLPDATDEAALTVAKSACLSAYQDYSDIFDRADAAYDGAEIDKTEYADIIEMLNVIGENLSVQFERFGFDPYAADLAYVITLTSSNVGNYVLRYTWDAVYNGSNIIINFDFKISITDRLSRIYVGGELLTVDAYGYNHATTDPATGAKYFSSNFGTVTLNSITMRTYSTAANGYITITNPTAFASWYNAGSRALFFNSRSDSGVDYDYYTDGTSGMNPTNIANIYIAMAQGTCSHSYTCTALDANSHRNTCSSCGYIGASSAHNNSLSDTTTSPGYTLSICSDCGYTVSKTANTYSVSLDMGTGDEADNLSIRAVYGEPMPDISIPERLGYSFAGIYTESDGAGTMYYDETGKSAHSYELSSGSTLYAHWTRKCKLNLLPAISNEFAVLPDSV